MEYRYITSEIASGVIMPEETRMGEEALKVLVDILAHDINNHVHGATGYMELMEHMMKEDPTLKRFLGNAMSEMKSISNLVDNISLLINVPNLPFEPEPVDIYPELVHAQEAIAYRFEDKELEIVSMLKHGEAVVKGDRFLQNALVEVLSNSIRYDSHIPVKVYLSATEEDGSVILVLGDQGKGIPDDQKEGLLTRFWRSIDNQDVHGKGMGLSVVKMVVDRYGGEVRLENRVEEDHTQGTKVIMKLPSWKE